MNKTITHPNKKYLQQHTVYTLLQCDNHQNCAKPYTYKMRRL